MSFSIHVKALICGVALAVSTSSFADGPSTASQAASMVSVLAVASVGSAVAESVEASAELPVALSKEGAEFVVKSVEAASNGVGYVMESVADGSRYVVKTAAGAVSEAASLAGQVASVAVVASGYALVVAGRVIAYFPGALEKNTFAHEQVSR